MVANSVRCSALLGSHVSLLCIYMLGTVRVVGDDSLEAVAASLSKADRGYCGSSSPCRISSAPDIVFHASILGNILGAPIILRTQSCFLGVLSTWLILTCTHDGVDRFDRGEE